MTREQAINYLISSGFSEEQVSEVVRALTYEPTTKNNLGVDVPDNNVGKIDCSNTDCNNCVNHKYCDYEPTIKNDLGVDCVSRKAVLDAIDVKAWEFCDYLISKGRNDEQKPVSHFADNLRECVREALPSVTPQLSSGLEKNSKKLEKDFGESDCISRADVKAKKIYSHERHEYIVPVAEIDWLPSVTPQPRKGHWISHREHCENLGVMPSGLGAYEWCSNCDCGIDVREWHRNYYNYCPNCGSDNREVKG